MSRSDTRDQLRAHFEENPSEAGADWLRHNAMDFREAITELLAGGGSRLTDSDRGFLQRWADALDSSTWKRIARKICGHFWLVLVSIDEKRAAEADAPTEEDHRLSVIRKNHWQTEESMAAAQALLLAPDLSEEATASAVARIRELQKQRAQHRVLVEQVLPAVVPTLHVSQKLQDRERCLFMQRLSIEMIEWFDGPNDLVVAAITTLMYQIQVSTKAVEKQRGYV